MTKKAILKTALIMSTFFFGVHCTIVAGSVIVVDDMEDYNDRGDIRGVWRDGYANVIWGGVEPDIYVIQGGSSGSNLRVSTEVGTYYNGGTAPYVGQQGMAFYYDNDGFTYPPIPEQEHRIYDATYYSEVEANTVGPNSLDVGQDWVDNGYESLSLWFQGHPVSDGGYDASTWPVYTQTCRGRDIWGRHDEFYFLSTYPFTTPGTVQVQVLAIENTNPWAKAGVMIREKWAPYSKFAAVFMTPGNGVSFQYRDVEDGPTTSITKPGVTTPQYVKLERKFTDNFIAKHSSNGIVWEDVNEPGQPPQQPLIVMGIDDPNLYIGTAVTSHDALVTCTAEFKNVLMSPLPTNWVYGDIGTNDAEQLYVALSDGTNTAVVEHPDVHAATLTSWQEWNIPLTAFTGVDFNSVKKVYIGLGDRDNPVFGGSGTVYIDDIMLYKPALRLLTPNGGEIVPAGRKYTITWQTLTPVSDVVVEYSTDCGAGWKTVYPTNTGNTGSYNWPVPAELSEQCLVRISEAGFLARSDISDEMFSIKGLVGHWRLDETSGYTADDSAGENDGSLYGETRWLSAGGQLGGALELDGVDDYVDCSNDVSLDITDELTLAAWVKTSDAGNGQHNPYVTKGDHSFGIKHNQNNNIDFFIYDSGWHTIWYSIDDSFNNQWHHLAGTYDGNDLKLYIDGGLEDTLPYAGSIASSDFSVNIGRNSEETARFYEGLIDDVRIYNYALSADEILQLLCTKPIEGDLDGNCKVDFRDFAFFASDWLTCNLPWDELCLE